jgi:hypothetical protein
MDDISEITQLVLRERQGRDRGWWGEMAACFHPDSRVTLSWFDGPGAEFVARSQKMAEMGLKILHRPSPPAVHMHGDKAVLELPLSVERRFMLKGVEADLSSYTRMLYQVEKRDGSWKILFMNAIYERDTLTPTLPGTVLDVDYEKIAEFRAPYRFVAYDISLAGRSMTADLYGDDQPERVTALYKTAFDWLGRSPLM